MPRTRVCGFCGDDIEPGTGTMFVRTNGATIHYCSSKCEKNHDLGRESRDLEWTEEGRPEEEPEPEPDETEETGEVEGDEGEVEPEEDDEESGEETEAEA
ncbi:MAG: 50S ribosomal protein L24e [Haloarculaceae archaeon]